MPGLFGILELGKRTLISQQIAQSIVGNNIANVNTEGYSRQRTNFEQVGSLRTPWGTIGLGVQVKNISRMRDALVDRLYRDASATYREWETKAGFMRQIDAIFTEIDDAGIGSKLDAFFNAWNDLANDPESSQPRIALRESARALTAAFNDVANKLKWQKENINTRISKAVDEFNNIIKKIAELNTKIPSSAANSSQVNELLDERDRLLDRLSEMADIQIFERSNQGIAVYAGSTSLIEGSYYQELTTTIDIQNDLPVVTVLLPDGNELEPTSGEFKALLELRDEIIPEYENDLNTLAKNIVEQVNAYHKVGYTLAGETGYNFFDNRYITAATIRLDPDIEEDANNIIAAAEDAAGDNTQALRIASLKNTTLIGDYTFRDYYASLITKVGLDGQTAEDLSRSNEILVNQTVLQRETTIGVSLDEEMVNLIRYQQSYLAASRMIATVDQMIEAIINLR
ncbi:MAG: flagellar hook-associated protein FlgK [candidate division KSB1 bacterium]|nr:flagellar hook-associated protein FlgK [candidate division KSB1 bacterium]